MYCYSWAFIKRYVFAPKYTPHSESFEVYFCVFHTRDLTPFLIHSLSKPFTVVLKFSLKDMCFYSNTFGVFQGTFLCLSH